MDSHIRCKCGKYTGLKHFRANKRCKRCKSIVVARGALGHNSTTRCSHPYIKQGCCDLCGKDMIGE